MGEGEGWRHTDDDRSRRWGGLGILYFSMNGRRLAREEFLNRVLNLSSFVIVIIAGKNASS